MCFFACCLCCVVQLMQVSKCLCAVCFIQALFRYKPISHKAGRSATPLHVPVCLSVSLYQVKFANRDHTSTMSMDSNKHQSAMMSPLLNSTPNDDDPLSPPSIDDVFPTQSSRVLDRDGDNHQSRGHWGVQRLRSGARLRQGSRSRLQRFWENWFHSLAYKPTFQLMAIIFMLYCGAVFFFAGVYLGIAMLGNSNLPGGEGSFCRMDINNHMDALYFSLSTMTTIGYGVSDYYFGDCWTPLLLVLWQSCTAIAFQSVAIGLLFQRISRGQKRGKTIIFSDKAVVQRVKGVPHFMFRVAEMRSHFLIEAHVRCYCLRHERCISPDNVNQVETTLFLTRHMKLLHPDESIGSHILMTLPQVIVHRMDELSPLVPNDPIWYDANGSEHTTLVDTNNHNPSLQLDHSTTANDRMQHFLRDRQAEIVVLVEGTDEITGSTVQARHSYRVDDIAWDHTFQNCILPYSQHQSENCNWMQQRCDRRLEDPICAVDYAKFHNVVPVSPDSLSCPYIPR